MTTKQRKPNHSASGDTKHKTKILNVLHKVVFDVIIQKINLKQWRTHATEQYKRIASMQQGALALPTQVRAPNTQQKTQKRYKSTK